MVRWALLAAAVGLGMETRRLVIVSLAVLFPLPASLLVALHWWRARPRADLTPVMFTEGVAGELRSGASLRQAVERSAASSGASRLSVLARQGAPWDSIAREAAVSFPTIGNELLAVLEAAPASGGPIGDIFRELAAVALAEIEVHQEVASASAPARATAAVLLLIPVAPLLVAGTRGTLPSYLQTPAQRTAAGAGLVLVVLGVAAGVLLFRRAR